MTQLTLKLIEPKKHSGKYVLEGTERDQWPTMMYLKKDWFPNEQLPNIVKLTVEPQ